MPMLPARVAPAWTPPSGGGGSGGVTVHNLLSGRAEASTHPISSIAGLIAALAGKLDDTGGTATGNIALTGTADFTVQDGFFGALTATADAALSASLLGMYSLVVGDSSFAELTPGSLIISGDDGAGHILARFQDEDSGDPVMELRGDGKLLFGAAGDTNLYRIAADLIGTDDVFRALVLEAAGMTGSTTNLRLVGANASGPPASGAHNLLDIAFSEEPAVYVCTVAGTPGTWVDITAAVADGLADHIADAVAAHDATAIATTPTGDLTGIQVMANLTELDARLSALLEYSPDLLQAQANVYDDFFGNAISSGAIGQAGWATTVADTGVTAAAVSGIANAPGTYTISTGTGAAGAIALNLGVNQLQNSPLFVCEMRVAPVLLNNGTHDATWRIGLHDATTGGTPSDGMWFELTGADSSVHARCNRGGGTPSDVDTGFTLGVNVFARYTIVSDGAGNIYFFIDGNQVALINGASVPNASTHAYGPCMGIIKTAGTGTSRVLTIDYFYLRVAAIR
jgi:hypothetical protein